MDEFIAPVNPFPGIRSYEPHEDYLFFGRENQIKELIERLSETRFIAIIGSSGCGKSSLIKAGLIPTLFKGKINIIQGQWELSTMRPGDDPLGNLASALYENFISSGNTSVNLQTIQQHLQPGGGSLQELFNQNHPDASKRQLLYIDQFEELFRFKRTRVENDSHLEAARFVELMLQAVRSEDNPIYIVLSMRSDFVDECTEYRGLTEAINTGYYLVPRMIREEIRKVITGPISVLNGLIEPSLIERLLDEVGTDPDQLPILQHALMRTWDYWKIKRIGDEAINHSHYDAIGTMKEALSIHAEEIFSELTTPRSKALAEKLFKALIDFGEENKGSRRPTRFSEICSLAEARPEEMLSILDRFREPGRAFLMPPYRLEVNEDTVIDISHESIMRVWTRLKLWYEEELQSAQLYIRLARSARMYQEGKTGLWVNPELQLALRWNEQNKPNAVWAVRYDPAFESAMEYLSYSKKVFDQEIFKKENQQKRNIQRTRRFSIILGVASVISVLFLILALNMMFKSEANEKKALEKEQVAIQESKAAAEQTEEAIIQKKISEQQQQIAEQQKIITEEQKDYAIEQQQIAEGQKKEAFRQRQLADNARIQAIQSRDEAETQRKEAVNQKQIADQERNKASVSEQNAQRLRMIAIGKAIAIQSAKMQSTTEGDLPALLAQQAFSFLQSNEGNLNDPDVYNALSAIADEKPILRGHTDEVRALLINKSGNFLYTCSADGSVKRWNIEKPAETPQTFNLPKRLNYEFRCLALSMDQKHLAAGTTSGDILIFNTSNTSDLPLIFTSQSGPLAQVCYCNDEILASSSNNGILKIWDLKDKKPVEKRNIQQAGKISSLVFREDNKLLYFGTVTGQVFSLSINSTSEPAAPLLSSGKSVTALALSRDHQNLAVGLSSGLVKIVPLDHPETGQIDLIGHISAVTSLVFSTNGKSLASGSYDRTIRLWDYLEAASPPILIDDNDKWVYGITFTPDQEKVISCGADKTIRIFQVNPEALSGRICKIVKRNLTPFEWNKYIGNDIPYQKTCTNH
ncbi:MAG: hypothetical protein AB9842_05270 [Bacteroidales bacterium]